MSSSQRPSFPPSFSFVIPEHRLGADEKALLVKEIGEILFGGKKLKTDEAVKAFSDESEGSKSKRMNQVGKDDEHLESKSQGTKDEHLENRPEKKRKNGGLYCLLSNAHPLDYYARRDRAENARPFTDRYKFIHGLKICIHPNGPRIECLSDHCLKQTWVGVYGTQSMCIVTRRDMDTTCLDPFYQRDCMKDQIPRMFARTTISEVECLPHKDVDYYDVAFRRLCAGTVKKPFAVVSLGEGAHGEFCSEDSKPLRHCALKTISYLESVVSSDSLNTHYGIIRVALEAYQLLCGKELRAEDLFVTIMEDFGRNLFDFLPIDVIGEQLDLVNGRSTEKDPEKPLIIKYRGSF